MHAVVVDSSVGRGRITGIDTGAADGPARCAGGDQPPATRPGCRTGTTRGPPTRPATRLRVFQDDQVRFFGQPVAVVVATTLEAAQHAASLVEVAYAAEQPSTDLASAPADEPATYARGDADAALGAAAVRLEMTYRPARNHHNPMEPHATIARWDGDRLTVWDKTQWVAGTAEPNSPPSSACPRSRSGSSRRSSAARSAPGFGPGRTSPSRRSPPARSAARSSSY